MLRFGAQSFMLVSMATLATLSADYVAHLEAFVDQIETTTMSAPSIPDPDWSYTDPAGHAHRFDGKDLPTLDVEYVEWFDADGEEYGGDIYTCRECHAEVEPHWIPDPTWVGGVRTFIPGLMSATLTINNGEQVWDVSEVIVHAMRTPPSTLAELTAMLEADEHSRCLSRRF